MQKNFRDICNLYNLEDLAREHGVKLRGRGNKWGVCPFPHHIHSNNTPSFSVFSFNGSQYFKCHGNCGAQGDAIDFIGFMQIPGYDRSDIKMKQEASARLQYGRKISFEPIVVEKKPKLLPQYIWEDTLPISDNVKGYLMKRGVSEQVIDENRFGSVTAIQDGIQKNGTQNILSIPTFHLGSLMGIKFRDINKKFYFSYTGSKPGVWNHDDVYLKEDPILVAKGEICAAVMKSAGFLACSLTSGESNNSSLNLLRDALIMSKRIIYFSDNDRQGRAAGELIATMIGGTVAFPEKEKDWDEWYLIDKQGCIDHTKKLLWEKS